MVGLLIRIMGAMIRMLIPCPGSRQWCVRHVLFLCFEFGGFFHFFSLLLLRFCFDSIMACLLVLKEVFLMLDVI